MKLVKGYEGHSYIDFNDGLSFEIYPLYVNDRTHIEMALFSHEPVFKSISLSDKFFNSKEEAKEDAKKLLTEFYERAMIAIENI